MPGSLTADLETLFFFLASNVASPYTYSRLADLVGSSDKTVHKDEDDIREGGYAIRVVPAWRYLLEQESG